MKVRNIFDKNFSIPIPIFGIGCGVLGLSLQKVSINMGKFASTLLKALEYRGYDSTGAAIQDDKKKITLLKDVGAPSKLVKTLGIEKQEGKLFCGQVRWATFGSVTKQNAQPHEVKCKKHIYGAHNGNITNTPELKIFLTSEGHTVVSDNDGEMLVHTIEHYFDIELTKHPKSKENDYEIRRACMKKAILTASQKVVGSYAAVIIDPVTEISYAIKAGSSLYFGIGEVDNNKFGLASSDLTAVLRYTKNLVELKEGDFVEYNSEFFNIYAFKNYKIRKLGQPDINIEAGEQIVRKAVRSKLRAEDIELLPEYNYFMEQEIHNETETAGKLIKLFQGGSNTGRRMLDLLERKNFADDVRKFCDELNLKENFEEKQIVFDNFVTSDFAQNLFEKIQSGYPEIYKVLITEQFEKKYFFSQNMNTYIDLIGKDFDKKRILIAKVLDSITEKEDFYEFEKIICQFVKLIKNTAQKDRNIYALACGTSFHASKTAALYFNEIAGVEIIPVLPGDFRGQYSKSLRDDDVIIGVSQSGETKDLIDIFNDIDNSGLDIKKIVLVNNMNSTLGQEKSDVSIPIYCGPEIAVPATKSFINQLTLFYYLAIKVAEMKSKTIKKSNNKTIKEISSEEIQKRFKTLKDIPFLISETIRSTKDQIEEVASKIYMEPSMHLLATKLTGVAKEGALKIRETVLNHAEGGEASEFKHGPNTILGRNTVFGIKSIKALIKHYNYVIEIIEDKATEENIDPEETKEIITAVSNYLFERTFPFNLSKKATELFKEIVRKYDFFEPLYRNYPLIYITGPDKRDVNLTISQINTHKIRGGDSFIIAEANERLKRNASTNPHENKYYGWGYIELPKTGDSLMTTFSATIVLQLLAFKMCLKKMEYLDKLLVKEHGVHPDVPKNVSKSITVD